MAYKTPGVFPGWKRTTGRDHVGLEDANLPSSIDLRWAYWLLATIVSGAMAAWLAWEFHSTPFPPGGDPGNWVATSYIYLGRSYPSQLIPLGYPPLLFPILGVFVAAFGPVNGVQAFAPVLLFGLGLSTYWLASMLLRSRVTAFLAVSLLLIDPAFLEMFYWGAYPNLLAFAFMNLAWVGVIRASRGRLSSGAFQFWLFFTATVLTHSLVGLALALGAVLFFGFATLTRPFDPAALMREVRQGHLESPTVAAHALFRSRGGLFGLLLVLVTVGGYYGGTFAFGIAHPDYFSTSSAEFAHIPYGTIFEAIVPHVFLGRALAFDLLLASVGLALAAFAILRDRRPAWLTPTSLILLAWLLSPILLAVGGILLEVITDYHRFGFLLLTPLVLAVAFVWESAWVLRSTPPAPAATPAARPPARLARWGWSPPSRRPIALALLGSVLLITVAVTTTGPAMARADTQFTKVGHDPMFLDAVGAIRHSGIRGGTLTVSGAEKWTRAMTAENAYAPSSPLYLFYPSQATDADLAYYALVSHYALTNGWVTASLHAANPTDATGLPDYSVSLAGPIRPVLRVVPQTVVVDLYESGTGQILTEGLAGTPAVSLPSGAGAPMTVEYTEPGFTFVVEITVDPASPSATAVYTVTTTGPYSLRSVAFALEPEPGAAASITGTGSSGEFDWQLLGPGAHPVTVGMVSPSAALVGASDYVASAGGPAVEVEFRAPQASGAPTLSGSLSLLTASAASAGTSVPPVLSAPAIWSDLGVRFVLMRNASYSPNPVVAFPDEVGYLVREYGLLVLYANPEWTVLLVPPPSG